MLNLVTVACALLGNVVIAFDFTRQLGFLRTYEGVHKQLDEHAKKLGLQRAAQKIPLLWFEQKLDHLAPSNTETWNQRYAEKMTHYGGENLVFLTVEGEGEMSTKWLVSSLMAEQAVRFKAATFVLEHRFYGMSRPKPDLTIDSLKYLSSEQALADTANFIRQMNIKHKFKNPKWIVFGCSYPGSLVTWLRYKHPELVYAAVSASGPLHAKADFPEYLETATKTIASIGGEKCVETIRDAHRIMNGNIHEQSERDKYKELFNLCRPIDNDENDIASFFSTFADPFGSAAQYKNEAAIKQACQIMIDEGIEDPVHRYAKSTAQVWPRECKSHKYSDAVASLRETAYDEYYMRSWFYQTCTEFGWFQTSDKKNATFGENFPVEMNFNLCKDACGSRFNKEFINNATDEINSKYKGQSIQVSRVVFVHGSYDPWSPLGIKDNPPNGSYAILIKGEAHCSGVHATLATDSPGLKEAKQKIAELLRIWVEGENQRPEEPSFFEF